MAGNYTPKEKQFLKRLGKAIKEKRTEEGISQEKLAEITGLHRTYIGSVERGERNVSAINIKTLAGALKCKPSELFQIAE
ncbi:helix-turn-helix domain-containing protein [Salidesulfovibrio onnuriiensis]|uniref:helix-turn-helix domain-containing protein n=1 Tax=Salidesulfovibrio onnuriiensis TaxID=2583823 RepID=UPI0011C8971B|nr:helix-turn-helix transcriptional regulator [Salidesulfovibrio onnuriiensis]